MARRADPGNSKVDIANRVVLRQLKGWFDIFQTSHRLAFLAAEVHMVVRCMLVVFCASMAGCIFRYPIYIHNLMYQTIVNQSVQHTVDRHPVA